MADLLHCEIITNSAVLLKADSTYVSIPSSSGEIGLFPGHAPLVSSLTSGVLYCDHDNTQSIFAIHWGYLEVSDNRVLILANLAEKFEIIDVERSKLAQQKAEKLISSIELDKSDQIDAKEAEKRMKLYQAKLSRSLTRQRASELGRR